MLLDDMAKELRALGRAHAERDEQSGQKLLDSSEIRERAVALLESEYHMPQTRVPMAVIRQYCGYYEAGYTADQRTR